MTHSTISRHVISIVRYIRMEKYVQAHAGGPISQKGIEWVRKLELFDPRGIRRVHSVNFVEGSR